jgi:hypothetical protein
MTTYTVTLFDSGSTGRVAFNRIPAERVASFSQELLRNVIGTVGTAGTEIHPTNPDEKAGVRITGKGVGFNGGICVWESDANHWRQAPRIVLSRIMLFNPPRRTWLQRIRLYLRRIVRDRFDWATGTISEEIEDSDEFD